MQKKVNIKKFLGKFTQNNLLEKLFKIHNLKNIPNIISGPNDTKVSELWFEYYKSLDLEERENLNQSFEKINQRKSKYIYIHL